MLWALCISFVLSLLPFGKYLLYPFKLFTTWVHECSHAFVALLMGGTVKKITLSSDTSGLTYFQLPNGRLRESLVASAGYMGSSIFGCFLYFIFMQIHVSPRWILLTLGALLLLSGLIWIRNLFGLLAVFILGSGFIALGHYSDFSVLCNRFASFLVPFLAMQTALNSIFDIRTLWSLEPRAKSDAQTMQSLFYLPAGFWAFLWMSLSLGLMFWTIKLQPLNLHLSRFF